MSSNSSLWRASTARMLQPSVLPLRSNTIFSVRYLLIWLSLRKEWEGKGYKGV